MTGSKRSAGDRGLLISVGLALTAVVLIFGALLGTARASFLVQDLAYLGSGGLSGVACLALAGAVYVSSRSQRRCDDLDRLCDARSRLDPLPEDR